MKAIRNSFLLILVSMTLFVACKNKGTSSKKMASDFSIEIIHSGCRGNCPAFTIKVDSEGNASYEGRRAVEMMGMYKKTLDSKTMSALSAVITDGKFFDFDDAYGAEVADIPAIITTVTMNGKTKRVEDVRNAPKELKELEAKMEGLIGMTGWDKAE